MTKRRLYYLTDDGLTNLMTVLAFKNLSNDQRQSLEEYLQTAFCGSNRVDEKVLRFRLQRIHDIVGLGVSKQLISQIRDAMRIEEPPT
jgi:hypothetical protein